MLAFLAEVHLRSNSPTSAFRVAERGMAVATERCSRLAECRATIVLAQAAGIGGLQHPHYRADELLARARRLIDETGALSLENLLAAARPATTAGSAK
jgi:adenylate cyclase